MGDRLDTDIEGAVRSGADSLLVFTGVTRPEDVLLAGPRQRPTYLAADLSGLLEPHPAVDGDGTTFRCGGWTARYAGPGEPLALDGSGDSMDGLRALCAAAWSADQVTAEMVAPALSALGRQRPVRLNPLPQPWV